ncbi:hypothetical protein F8C76_04665 [Flagellimonas olearia]|uniref:Uncharacterized protein n=1 Tax=Flagellimonas olearia TaxID=552546 RepID=A0A6I1E4M5_9FLAO|nr:hypothetical protein [Allomuricauda olearia]KAB7530795.1 hypothetical protein F8C76_04665 [Allomuricauda olearia]
MGKSQQRSKSLGLKFPLSTIGSMNYSLLYNTIHKIIEKEDSDLASLTGKGIFYAPELYLAFIVGKEIKREEASIFGHSTEWIRETNFGNGGPTDFAFKAGKRTYAFELKVRDNYHSYASDIEKLNQLDDNYDKFFVALVDSWESKKDLDERILSLENQFPGQLNRINDFRSFPTLQDRYKGKVCCTLAVWKIQKTRASKTFS